MKQLLIVNSAKALNAKKSSTGAEVTPYDLSNLAEGAISFFELGSNAVLAAAATKNFGIALGRKDNIMPFVFSEVNIDTLDITVTQPKAGTQFKAEVTIPTPEAGKNYGLTLVKKGTVIKERYKYSVTDFVPAGGSKTAANMAKSLGDQLQAYADTGQLDITVTVSSAKITVKSNNYEDQFELKATDSLYGVTITTTDAEPNIGDTAYIKKLAQQCAAGKGFVYTSQSSKDIYPGYPEPVEEIAQADIATKGYVVFNLRFATKREAGKTMDEAVWQYVHIAVPKNNSSYSTIATILPAGNFLQNKIAAASAASASAASTEEPKS